jgi:hypothetical protein
LLWEHVGVSEHSTSAAIATTIVVGVVVDPSALSVAVGAIGVLSVVLLAGAVAERCAEMEPETHSLVSYQQLEVTSQAIRRAITRAIYRATCRVIRGIK